ncbi:MAG: rRNA maturation RNase YbeY [Candidatus Kaelpia aquatica]|nr:rRNA maturation RNase YbeY [Candidatus Kaelpia aquatica]
MAKKNFDIVVHSIDAPLKKNKIASYFEKIIEVLPEAKGFSWSIAVVSDRDMRILNKNYKDRDKTTDVLAFFYPNGDPQAEIVISSEMAVKNAPCYNNSPEEEFLTYLIHGVLHILGYNDIRKGQKDLMFKKQSDILGKIL